MRNLQTVRAPRDTSPGARTLFIVLTSGGGKENQNGYAKMHASRLLLLALPSSLCIWIPSPRSSCQDSQDKKQSSNSKPTSVNQVKEQTKTDNSAGIPKGVWRGVHIQMQATDKGADIEYDCAHGTISEPIKPMPKDASALTAHTHWTSRDGTPGSNCGCQAGDAQRKCKW